jgi:hypothetical protein
MVLTPQTSPAARPGLKPTEVELATVYMFPLKVPVVDQFGNALSSIYEGTPVTETIAGKENVPINQKNDRRRLLHRSGGP